MKHVLIISQMLAIIFLALPLATQANSNGMDATSGYKMSVYKTPTCGCCHKWVDHMSANGFSNELIDVDNLNPLKAQLGIAGRYRSCHTGVVTTSQGDYVFEGHVPAQYVKQFLDKPPVGALGLSVPGMPVGSPGMEVGERKDYYQVLLLNIDGSHSVFAEVNKPEGV